VTEIPPARPRGLLLRQAIALAVESAGTDGGPFGAVVARGDTVISTGTNRVTSSGDPTAHAEIVAIRRAADALGTHDLSGCTLYASTEPCPMCLAATWWARIGEIVFAADRDAAARAGFDDAAIYKEVASDREVRAIPCVQHLAEEGEAPFEAWAANPARQPY
jgi:tRNA(Arg) A34 adenosine deaminase TadA